MGITYSEGEDPYGRKRSQKRTRRAQLYRDDLKPTGAPNAIPRPGGQTLSNILRGAPASGLPNPADVNRMFAQLTRRKT